MPRAKEVPEDFDVKEAWEELKILIEALDKDLKKTITKGTKRAGVNTRRGIMYAKELLTDIYHGTIHEQRRIRENKPPHGNQDGAGIKAMHEARNIKKTDN